MFNFLNIHIKTCKSSLLVLWLLKTYPTLWLTIYASFSYWWPFKLFPVFFPNTNNADMTMYVFFKTYFCGMWIKLEQYCYMAYPFSLLLEIVKLQSKVPYLLLSSSSIIRIPVSTLLTSILYCQTLTFGSLSIKLKLSIKFLIYIYFNSLPNYSVLQHTIFLLAVYISCLVNCSNSIVISFCFILHSLHFHLGYLDSFYFLKCVWKCYKAISNAV